MKTNSNQKITISKLAQGAQVNPETIRFYEKKGLLKQPNKSVNGFRYYSKNDITLVQFIKKTQSLGFTLKEIKTILELNANPKATCNDVKSKTLAKIKEIDKKINDLMVVKKSLGDIVTACNSGKNALQSCHIVECFEKHCKCNE